MRLAENTAAKQEQAADLDAASHNRIEHAQAEQGKQQPVSPKNIGYISDDELNFCHGTSSSLFRQYITSFGIGEDEAHQRRQSRSHINKMYIRNRTFSMPGPASRKEARISGNSSL